MKTIVALITALLLIVSTSFAFAEEYETLSIDELKQIRDEMIVKLNAVNTALGQKIRTNELTDSTIEGNAVVMPDGTININLEELPLGKIKDLFPDKALAKFVRDNTGKISIEQTVTQTELDKIDEISIFSDEEYGDFTELTGIGYLRNLKDFRLYNSMDYLGTEFPEEFYALTKLEYLAISTQEITSLSELLGNFTNLKYLDVSNTKIASLPESIGNLTKLYSLNISYTNIKELPDSIWNLQLKTFEMKGLPIE